MHTIGDPVAPDATQQSQYMNLEPLGLGEKGAMLFAASWTIVGSAFLADALRVPGGGAMAIVFLMFETTSVGLGAYIIWDCIKTRSPGGFRHCKNCLFDRPCNAPGRRQSLFPQDETAYLSPVALSAAAIFAASLFVFFAGGAIMHIHTGHGEHIGYVTAESSDGLLWKTTDVYFKTDTQSTQEDAYCLRDHTLDAKIQEFAEKHIRGRVTFEVYQGWAHGCAWSQGGPDLLTGIEPVEVR